MTTPTWSTGKRPPLRRAFTLVELVVVMILVAVLAGMAIPRLAGSAASTRLKEQANALLTSARYAREYAVTHCCDCRLVIDTAANQFALQRQEIDTSGTEQFVSIGLGWGRPVVLTGGVRFGRVRIEPAGGRTQDGWVTFRPDGQTDATIVEITDGRKTYSLLLVPNTGRAKLADGTVQSLPNDRVDLDA